MATTKKTTTTRSTIAKKTPAKQTAKPKLEIVKEAPAEEMSVFEKVAARFPINTDVVDIGDGITIEVVNRIPLTGMLELIQKITDACIDEESGQVHFHMLEFAAKLFITAVYCNVEVPEDIELGYNAVCGADRIYDRIVPHIDPDQLKTIWDSCSMKLKAKQDMFSGAAAQIAIGMVQRINELYEMIGSVTQDYDSAEALSALKDLSTLVGGNKQ